MNGEQSQASQEIKLSQLLTILWRSKIAIVLFTFICTSLTVMYAVSKPDIYTVEGLYTPKSANGGSSLSKLAGQFGGLASMAGINLGGGSGDKTDMALEVLKSRAFLQAFIEKYDLVTPLMAAERWDKLANKLIYNEELFDTEKKQWIREVPANKNQKPTAYEAFSYLESNLSVEYMTKKGIIKIKLSYYSPEIAAEWLALVVAELNGFWQQKELKQSEKLIELLTQKAVNSGQNELKAVLYSLVAEQTKSYVLAQVEDETLLQSVAGIVIPEEKSAPSRALLCIIALFFSGLLAVVVALIIGVSRERKRLSGL
jgi:uncharacterized protein involved in exopolysaccharide biosynthesis